MGRRHFLQRKREAGAQRKVARKPTTAGLLELLRDHVVDRFAHMSVTHLQAVALAVSEPDEENPAPNPSHPACQEFSASDYCRESWQLHLAKLKHRPETHWGTCRHMRVCAMVPVVHRARCLAVVKLAGPAPVDESELKRLVEVIELLARDFVASHADFLSRVPGGTTVEDASEPLVESEGGKEVSASPIHPQIARAVEYIAEHLSDPHLTVARVSSVLDLYPTYLSELFAKQMRQRMSRYIASRRIELAKKLLATTDWQVKRIALETGHANPNWFCHVFSAHTGLTPGEYRASARV